ncbi:hypothetical protein As57867_004236, partial [Aphanomyces stellatus]
LTWTVAYLTPLGGQRQSTAGPLKLIQSFMHARQDRDIFTGLQRSKMHMGRPDWKTELNKVARQTSGDGSDIGEFLCGSPALDRGGVALSKIQHQKPNGCVIQLPFREILSPSRKLFKIQHTRTYRFAFGFNAFATFPGFV